MHSPPLLSSLVLLLASSAMATINTPTSLIECQPSLISWSASTSPYYLSVIGDGDASNILEQLGTLTTTSYTWTVDLASGTNVSLALTDGTGASYYSASVIIQSGSSTSCLNSTSGSSADSSSTATSTLADSSASMTTVIKSSSSTSSGSKSSSTSKSASSSTASSASSSSSSSSTTSGASSMTYSAALATLLGAVALMVAV